MAWDPTNPDALIIGGGVAGLSAAAALAARGVHTLLIEEGGKLGGKLQANIDPDGDAIEHGIHGWWEEYVNFRGLLEQAGIGDIFSKPLEQFNVWYRDGTWAVLRPGNLMAPFGYLQMLRESQRLSTADKLWTALPGLSLASFDSAFDYQRLLGIDLASWMRRHFLPRKVEELAFEPTVRANLFLPNVLTSASDGINSLVRGTRRRDSWRVCWLKQNSNSAVIEPLKKYIEEQGGAVWESSRAEKIVCDAERVATVHIRRQSEEILVRPAHVVVATDIPGAKKLTASLTARWPALLGIQNLSTTDVIVSRLWYRGTPNLAKKDGVLLRNDVVDAFLAISAFQSEFGGEDKVVLETQTYRARPWMRAPEDVVKQRIREDLENTLPELKSATLLKHVLVRHHGVFTAFRAGEESFRPAVRSPIPNLFFAADWVRIAEPVMFMERAVTAGRHAANHILRTIGKPVWPILPLPAADLPVRFLRAAARSLHRFRRLIGTMVGYQSIGGYDGA